MKEQMPRCKFCGALTKTDSFGEKFEVFCPEQDSKKCPYPPFVEGKNLEEVKEQWKSQFGAQLL